MVTCMRVYAIRVMSSHTILNIAPPLAVSKLRAVSHLVGFPRADDHEMPLVDDLEEHGNEIGLGKEGWVISRTKSKSRE